MIMPQYMQPENAACNGLPLYRYLSIYLSVGVMYIYICGLMKFCTRFRIFVFLLVSHQALKSNYCDSSHPQEYLFAAAVRKTWKYYFMYVDL